MRLSKRAFTLLEVLLAVAIVTIAIVGLLELFVYTIVLSETNRNLATAVNDAQYVLEWFQGRVFDTIESLNPDTLGIANLQGEDINATWVSVNSNLKTLTITVNWNEKGRQRQYVVSTRISRWQ